MEPIVKLENCDDVFIEQADITSSGVGQKRQYTYLGEENECDELTDRFNVQHKGFSAPGNRAAQLAKRYRRGESAVLFSPPFFEVPENSVKGDTIMARCLSCQVMLRGHKNVSSNFLKHMKRAHPEVHKMYENYKILKQHGVSAKVMLNKPTATAPRNLNDVNTGENELELTSENPTDTNSNTDFNDSVGNSNEVKNQGTTNSQPEVNLSNKTLQVMSRMFDEKLKSFATKTELNEVTNNIMNQVRSRQPTPSSTTAPEDEYEDNEEVEEKFRNFENELRDLRERLEQSEQSKRILQRELHSLEKVVRRRKLIISNIPIAPNQLPKAAVDQLFRQRFNMHNVMIESVNVITNRNRQNQGKQTLLVELMHENDVNAIFRQSACLKNTGIYIESQMSQISIRRKEKLLVLRREMMRRNGSLRILVRNTHLLVCDVHFYWDDLLGLCKGNLDLPNAEFVCGDEAAEELQKITNLDMKEFLNVLKNYDIK